MKNVLCAGAIALAMTGLLPTLPATASDYGTYAAQGMATSVNIARIKSALHLTPAQERHWAPVEAALRELARRQERDANDGMVRRVSKRVVQIALNSATVHRLVAAARPLVKTFDEQQMQTAHGLAQEMGLGPVVAAMK